MVHQLDFDPNPVREHAYATPALDHRGRDSLLPSALSVTVLWIVASRGF